MASFEQVRVTTGGPARLLGRGDGDTLLYNTDATATVWLSDDPLNLEADGYAGAPLPPGASVAVDGRRPVFAVTASGTALVTVIPGGRLFFQLVEIVVQTLILTATAGNGLFAYNPSSAFGDLVASVLAQATTDQWANAALPGISSYGARFAASLQAQALGFYAGSAAGPWTQIGSIGPVTGGLAITSQGITPGAGGLALQAQTAVTIGGIAWIFPSGDTTGATDKANLSNAIGAGQKIYLLPGVYYFGGLAANSGVTIDGPGYLLTTCNYADPGNSGYFFNLDPPGFTTTAHVEDFEIHGLTLQGACDFYWGANVVRCKITGNHHVQLGAGNAVMNSQAATGSFGTGYLSECEFSNKETIHGNPRTIEAWHIDETATLLRSNDCIWHAAGNKLFSSADGDTSQYWFRLIGDGAGSMGSKHWTFRDLIFELSNGTGGLFHISQTQHLLISNVSSEDLGPGGLVGNPLILLDTAGPGANQGVQYATIEHYSRRSGGQVLWDLWLDATCQDIEIRSPSQSSGGAIFSANVNGAANIALTGRWPQAYRLQNMGNAGTQIQPFNFAAAVATPAYPATGVAVTNTTGRDVRVHCAGGAVTAFIVNGTTYAVTNGDFFVPAGTNIQINYTAPGTWTWY